MHSSIQFLSGVALLFPFFLSCSKPVNSDLSGELAKYQSEWVLLEEEMRDYKERGITPPKSLGGTPCPPRLNEYLRGNHSWSVVLRVSITADGTPTKAECVSETTDMGAQYAEWAKTWRFRPATFEGTPIQCIWQFRVPKVKSTTTVTRAISSGV